MFGRQTLPALVTMVALACGLAALEATRVGEWELALRLILLAAIADGVDGRLARQLRATSPMGGNLDSLADIVAFGVAPAFLFATYYDAEPAVLRFGVPLAFVLAGAYRLARFQAQPSRGFFRGLPITVAGTLLALAVGGPFGVAAHQAALFGIALAVLMACRHPFPKFTRSRWWLLGALAGAAVPVALWPRLETLAILASVVLGVYVIWGLVGRGRIEEEAAGGLEEVHGAGKAAR